MSQLAATFLSRPFVGPVAGAPQIVASQTQLPQVVTQTAQIASDIGRASLQESGATQRQVLASQSAADREALGYRATQLRDQWLQDANVSNWKREQRAARLSGALKQFSGLGGQFKTAAQAAIAQEGFTPSRGVAAMVNEGMTLQQGMDSYFVPGWNVLQNVGNVNASRQDASGIQSLYR